MTFEQAIYILYSNNPYKNIYYAGEAQKLIDYCDAKVVSEAKEELKKKESK